MNLYITAKDYKRAVTGQETTSLIGNLLSLNGTLASGSTSMVVSIPTTVNLFTGDPLTVFDGASSEIVTVTTNTGAGATTIPVSATASAHAGSTVVCSDGAAGSLADSIVRACSDLEDITYQPLFTQTVTETLPLQTMRATLGVDMQLYLHPTFFPISAVSACSIVYLSGSTTALDTSRVIIEYGSRLVKLPLVQSVTTSQATIYLPPISRFTAGQVSITYTAGYTVATLPASIGRAAVLLTSAILSDRENPIGAARLSLGHKNIDSYLRGDTTAESSLYKRAVKLLQPYTRKAW